MSEQNKSLVPDGVLLINKHAGVTSHSIVGMVRRIYNTRAVGHAGTLDPMATGVLVVLLGRAAKASEYLTGASKRYVARLRLGLTTDTQDTTGTTLSESAALPSPTEVEQLMPRFRGEILQIPPMVSALKVGGQKLVDLARRGVEVERKARPITVYSLICTPTDTPSDYMLDVTCSGGTYIRTLCADIGDALGCGGAMAALERRSACGFDIERCITVAELEQLSMDERIARLIPTETLFCTLPALHMPAFYDRLIGSGCAILLSKLHHRAEMVDRVRLCHADGRFWGLGEVVMTEEGLAIKAIKTFVL